MSLSRFAVQVVHVAGFLIGTGLLLHFGIAILKSALQEVETVCDVLTLMVTKCEHQARATVAAMARLRNALTSLRAFSLHAVESLPVIRSRGSLCVGVAVPTVKVIGSYRFFFASSDGREPPHIHVQVDRRVAKFWLDPVKISKRGHIPPLVLRELERLVKQQRLEFVKAWHDYFGN